MKETEYAVLGAILYDNEVLNDIKLILEPDDFSSPACCTLYRAMLEMKSGIDVVTLNAKTSGIHISIIMECNLQPTSANGVHYAKIVRDASMERKKIHICSTMANSPVDDVINRGISNLKELSITDTKLHKIGTIIEPVYRDMSNPSVETRGVKTRINTIDKALGSLRNGDLIILGARPGMGKSACVISVMLNMGINSDPVAIYSLEMSKEVVTERLLCQVAGVPMQDTILKMNMDINNEKLHTAIAPLHGLPIYIDDSTKKYNKIEQSIRQSVKEFGLKAVFIDYLQLIHTDRSMGDNKNYQLGYITSNLKSLAKEMNIPIILLSQLNRNLEQRPNKRPIVSDLRDSGEIENDADVIIFLYRDEVYNKNSNDDGVVEVNMPKVRNLSPAFMKLAFIKEYMKFADLANEYDDYND